MADRRITTEIVQMDSSHQVQSEDTPEDVEFQVPNIKRCLMDDFRRPSVLDAPVSEHMKVYLRIRPFSEEEIDRNESQGCLDVESDYVLNTVAPKDSHYYKKAARGPAKTSITTNKFTFSHIFKEDTSQKEFFNSTMLDLVKDFIDGQNCLVFSYGVTSSGKTYTIQGEPKDAGVLPRALDVLFNSISGRQWNGMNLKPDLFMGVTRLTEEQELHEKKVKERVMKMSCDEDMDVMSLLGDDASDISTATNTTVSSETSISSNTREYKDAESDFLEAVNDRVREETKVSVEDQGQIKYSIWVSFAEIYNEQIFDLLESIPKRKNIRRPCLKLSDDQHGSPYVKGLKFIHVTSADEAYKLLTIGQRNLKTACTKLNHNSSRSHCIFSIKVLRVIDKDNPHVARVSMLSLCDLAGSERYTKTKNSGERLKEAGNINTSLMTLGRCIETLRFNQSHKENPRIIPFRDSKLTRLFQNFFVGRGKAVMIVNVNQCASMFDETQHVFKFSAIASQVIVKQKPIFVKPKLPVMPSPKLIPRSSIMWATPAKEKVDVLPEASNVPLPEGSDDELNESHEMEVYTQENIDELLGVIEQLQTDLDEEVKSKAKLEAKIRKEVCDEMMKQFTEIEEQYSEQMYLREQMAEEMADKRIQILMNAERSKRKKDEVMVDGEDEWVSSVLLHQEKVKVEEKNATIKEQKEEISALRAELEQYKGQNEKWLKEKNDLENQVECLQTQLNQVGDNQQNAEEDNSKANLIENLTQQLQQSRERLQEQEGEIKELNDMLTEAGETFVEKEKEIDKLKELNTEYEKKLEALMDDLKHLERMAADSKVAMESADQSLSKREECVSTLQAEIRALEDEGTKYKNKARFFEAQIVEKEKEAGDWKTKYENSQEEYTKNQEALIHGFTAEITNLKTQIFNFKSQLYGIKSPLKSPGGSLRSPDAAKMRLFSMSPRKTPSKEVKMVPVHTPEKIDDHQKTSHNEQVSETKVEAAEHAQVKAEVDQKYSDLENILKEKTRELDNANQRLKEFEPLMKDYFSKSKLLTEAEIKVEKLSEDAEYKNKAILDCENRVQELETELSSLKGVLKEKGEIITKMKERENELEKKILEGDMKINDMEKKEVEIQTEPEMCQEDQSSEETNNAEEKFKLQIVEKEKEIESLKNKLSKLKSGYKAKDLYCNETSEKCMVLEFRINEKEIENQEFKSQVDEARQQMVMLQDVLNQKVEELARTGEELAVASLESEKSKRMVMEHKANCENLTTEIRSLKESLQTGRTDKLEESFVKNEKESTNLDVLKHKLTLKENELQEMVKEMNIIKNESLSVKEELNRAIETLGKKQTEIDVQRNTIAEKETEIMSISRKCNASQEDKAMQSELYQPEDENKEVEALKDKIKQSECVKDDLEKRLKEFEDKQVVMMEEIKKLEDKKQEVQKFESLLKEKDQMCSELSERVKELEEMNTGLQSELKEMKDKNNAIEKLQEKIQEKEEELDMFKENLDAALLELEGKEKLKDEIETLRKSTEEREKKWNEREQEIVRLESVVKELEDKISSLSNIEKKNVLEESMHDLESAVVDKEMELCQKESLIADQKSTIDNLKEEIEHLQKEKATFDEKIALSENEKAVEVSELCKVVKDKEECVKKAQSELQEANKEKEAVDEMVEELKKKLCKIEEEMEEKSVKNNSFEIERTRLQGKLEEAWEKIYKLEDEVEEKAQVILDLKNAQNELKDDCEDTDSNTHKDLLTKQLELESDRNRYKEMFEKIESELKEVKCELEKITEQKRVLEGHFREKESEMEKLRKGLHEKEEALSSQSKVNEIYKSEKDNQDTREMRQLKDQLDKVILEKNESIKEIDKYKQRIANIKESCDIELSVTKEELEKIKGERTKLLDEISDNKVLKESENELQSQVSLKNVEIETLKLDLKLLNEELNRVKTERETAQERLQMQEMQLDGQEKSDRGCDITNVKKVKDLQRLYNSEKKKNEEYQKLLTETSEMNCLSPQTGVRRLRKAKIDAENALVEAQYRVKSLESKVQELEAKCKCLENNKLNSISSPNTNDSLLQRKLNYFSTKLQSTETKNESMVKEVAELQATVERLEKELKEERLNQETRTEREVHRRSRVSFLQNDPRQSIGSPSTKIELCKTREREQNLREQLNKSNETMQEWLNKLVDTENQLKQKKQELKHAQETIQQLEARNSEGEKSISKEIQQHMEMTNELKLEIIKKDGALEQKSNLIEDLRRQLDCEITGLKTYEKEKKEKDELISLFKETLQEQETMLEEQGELLSDKEAELERIQKENKEIQDKYQHLLESKSMKQKDQDGDVRKIAHIEAECDLQVKKVRELETKLGHSEEELTNTRREKVDVEKKLKKVEDEKMRLKSALNENNVELKELEKTLTDVRKECEELKSQGADKNAAMHLEEAKRDMEKSLHELKSKVRNLQCQNKELSFKLSSAEEKLTSVTEDQKHQNEKELQKFRDERDKLVSALEACLKKKDTEIKQLKDVITRLKDKEIQMTQHWHEEREKIASGLMHLQKGKFTIKQEVEDPEENVTQSVSVVKSPVQDENKTEEEDKFTKPVTPQSSTRSSSRSRPPRPAPPQKDKSEAPTVIETLKTSPGAVRRGSTRRGKKRPSPSGADDLPPLPKRRSREPLAETSIMSESSEDYSTHLQIDATPQAAAKSLRRMRKKAGSVPNIEDVQTEESSTEAPKRGSKRTAKSRLLQSFRESPIGKTSKKLLENIAEKFSPTRSPTKSPIKSPSFEEEEPKKGRKRNKPSKENIPVTAMEVPEKKTSRGRGRHKLYKEDTYISEPFESTGEFIQSPDDVHQKVTRSLRSRRH